MASAPSILLIDDGELARVRYVLERLGVSFEHRTGIAAEEGVPRPRHLFVCSLRRARLVPVLEAPEDDCAEPIWVCAHTQDFLPMRWKLKEFGYHYLIHAKLDREVMRLFFDQLLYRGGERRLNVRLSVPSQLSYTVAGRGNKGKLEELSREGCRLFSAVQAEIGAPAVVFLPPELGRGDVLDLTGHVANCTPETTPSGVEGFSVIVVFRGLDAESQAHLESIMVGDNLGTRITPLEPLPDVYVPPPEQIGGGENGGEEDDDDKDGSDEGRSDGDRRDENRRAYARRLTALTADASDVLIGCDLSKTGIRIERSPAISVGDRIAIALYPSRREEPMIVDAEVLREDQKGLGLRFIELTDEQKARLDYMLDSLASLESRSADGGEDDRLIVSKLVGTRD